jgi:alpha-1,6-mannosyltransferase
LKVCDLTQSYSDVGGGIRTYLHAKRRFVEAETSDEHVLIVPGPTDGVVREGRLTTHTVASPPVPTSPHYRLLLRSGRVRAILREERPNVVETLDAYNLPWAALRHRRESAPGMAVVAGYRTDFPSAYVEPILRRVVGGQLAAQARRLAYRYAGALYRRMDAVYTLTPAAAARLGGLGVDDVSVLSLGVDLDTFRPGRRNEAVRRRFGVAPDAPLLVYVGRLDAEKRPLEVVEAFRQLPPGLGAHLVLVGEGPQREQLAALAAETAGLHVTGFVADRDALAQLLASADVYVSAMPHETFGISVVEAQASGLPVVGVASGAMPERVPPEVGRLGPLGDVRAMAANVVEAWTEREVLGRQARAHVVERFSWAETFRRLYALYDRVLTPSPRVIPVHGDGHMETATLRSAT